MASGSVNGRVLADGAVDDDQLASRVQNYFKGERKFDGLWTGSIVTDGTIKSSQSAILLGSKRVYVTSDNRILVEETQ